MLVHELFKFSSTMFWELLCVFFQPQLPNPIILFWLTSRVLIFTIVEKVNWKVFREKLPRACKTTSRGSLVILLRANIWFLHSPFFHSKNVTFLGRTVKVSLFYLKTVPNQNKSTKIEFTANDYLYWSCIFKSFFSASFIANHSKPDRVSRVTTLQCRLSWRWWIFLRSAFL